MPNSQARRWCFTINNFTGVDEARLRTLANSVRYLVFGRETGESGTPHLQGFVIFRRSLRFTAVKQRVGDTAHIEVARGTSNQAAEYCKKDGDHEEFGEVPADQGKRNDWEVYREWITELGRMPTKREVIREHTSLYARYPQAVFSIAEAYLEPPVLTDSEPRLGWQTLVAGRLQGEPPNRRSIDFVVDPAGNSGKSWLCQWALTKFPERVQVLRIGKRDDLAHAIDATKSIFLMDVPRNQMIYLQYSVLEMLKDQMIFSPKYQSSLKTIRSVPYVAVFSNEAPDQTMLTEDRYNIINV